MRALAAALVMLAAVPAAAAPRVNSDEYRRSWGLEAIGAGSAYRVGLTGRGVNVAVVDCGMGTAQRELRRAVRSSTDVVEAREGREEFRHGSFVAGPLVSRLDGRGMVGVAYNASLISVRADVPGGFEGGCAFRPSDLANALDYAVGQQARIVVLPMQARKPLGRKFEAALERVTESGAVVVIAAGNWTGSEPSYPARYATDPRYAGSIVVAGALSYYGALTPWSNRAGAARAWYIAAPGEWVLTDCKAKCALVSGTSFASSYVAGALALAMEAWPQLSGRDTVAHLLEAARDAGAAGVDPVYGRGVLDLARVFPAD